MTAHPDPAGADAARLAAVRERAAKAMPGPWRAYIAANTDQWMIDNWGPRWGNYLGSIVTSSLGPDRNEYARPNAEFIAEARADVPWLLAEHDRLVREVERLRSALQAVVDEAGPCDVHPGTRKCSTHFLSRAPCCVAEARAALGDDGAAGG